MDSEQDFACQIVVNSNMNFLVLVELILKLSLARVCFSALHPGAPASQSNPIETGPKLQLSWTQERLFQANDALGGQWRGEWSHNLGWRPLN